MNGLACGKLVPLLALLVALQACAASQPAVDLSQALRGIDEARFLACSGPPVVQLPQAGQVHMSFVTNLKRGQQMGLAGPTAFPEQSCLVDAVFEQHRLASSTFSGNPAMCNLVFAPCLGGQ